MSMEPPPGFDEEPVPHELPPHNVDAEEAVLGSLLIDAERCAGQIAFLDQEDFYRQKNATVYEAIMAILRRGDAVDQLTVAEQLKTTGEFQQVGGHAFLSHLVSIIPTSVHAPYYARIVHRTAALRRAIRDSHEAVQKAYSSPTDPRPLAHDYIRIGLGLLDLDTHEARHLKPVRDILDTHFNALIRDYRTRMQSRGVLLGLPKLDHVVGGLAPGTLNVIGARTSVGKTQLCLTVARNVARNRVTVRDEHGEVVMGDDGAPMRRSQRVAYFSVEQSERSIVARWVATEFGSNVRTLSDADVDERESEWVQAIGTVTELPVYVMASPELSSWEVHAQAADMAARVGLDLIVVDYLGILGDRERDAYSRAQEIGAICKRLRRTAQMLNVPMVLASQLSRRSEQDGRDGPRRPRLSDLRESGDIEQDADVVLLLHRDQGTPNQLEVDVAKNRDGPTGLVELTYNAATGRISSPPIAPPARGRSNIQRMQDAAGNVAGGEGGQGEQGAF